MGILEDLDRARTDFESGDWVAALDTWSDVEADQLGAADLRAAAQSAYLLGRRDQAVEFYQRAFRAFGADGDAAGAVRCAFHLSMVFATGGEPALAAGWTARAEGLLAELGSDPVERGYVSFLKMFGHLGSGEFPEASACAAETTRAARTHGDPELLALGLSSQGRMAIYSGDVAGGVALLDESMAGAAAGELSAAIFGNVYCTAIEGCQEISDFGRVAEWTSALHRWCTAQPGLVAFTGQCAVHRAQVMRERGAWPEALEELEFAVLRYQRTNALDAIGLAEYERGEIRRLRGEFDAAEAAYQAAAEHGYDPQPGLARLWLARGHQEAAAAAVRRLLGEVVVPVHRARLLPAAVDVLLAVAALEEARAAAADLERVADQVGSVSAQAGAAQASGAVELASGDPAGALPYLRKARQLWARAENAYEGARALVLVGRALTELGDAESGRRELAAALDTFTSLGAQTDLALTDRLLRPAELPAGLTGREVEVLGLVASGRSNAQIAAELVLSEKTVARHLSNIFAKLDVGSRTAAAAYAFEHDLV